MTPLRIFTGRQVLVSSRACHERGGLVVRAGSVVEVLESAESVQRAASETQAEVVDLGDLVLTPGFVDAHAHLELSDMRGRLSSDGSFPDWIRALLVLRAELDEQGRASAYEDGAAELARSGCTLVADIDSCGLASSGRGAQSLRVVAYREALDIGDAERRESALRELQQAEGLEAVSPHSPYSSSPELARALGELARERELVVGVHWAESPEEDTWLAEGRGPFEALLGSGLPSPKRPGLELLIEAGLLNSRLALYHANHPRPGEARLVCESGASVVHCPGTHAFFSRPPFPLELWQEAGVNLALGTDSLASNEKLDMQRELRLLREAFPALAPAECFRMATENGARAMGLSDRAGRLQAGAWADFVAFETEASGLEGVLDAVTSGHAAPRGTWIGGSAVKVQDEA